jgi:hypothetical protein
MQEKISKHKKKLLIVLEANLMKLIMGGKVMMHFKIKKIIFKEIRVTYLKKNKMMSGEKNLYKIFILIYNCIIYKLNIK